MAAERTRIPHVVSRRFAKPLLADDLLPIPLSVSENEVTDPREVRRPQAESAAHVRELIRVSGKPVSRRDAQWREEILLRELLGGCLCCTVKHATERDDAAAVVLPSVKRRAVHRLV